MPVDQRIQRRGVDRNRVDPLFERIALSGFHSIERNPSVLLPDEMKHRQVSESSPEDKLAFRVERDSDCKTEHRNERIQPRPALEFICVEIDSKTGRPN